jgi:VanZ family protein
VWIVLGVAAFTLYGSLVPFHFRALALADACRLFRNELAAGIRIESRSDAIANVMLGVPLGFALLGLASVDRTWSGRASGASPRQAARPAARWKIAAVGLLLLPACALFAAAVEFSQLFTLSRMCSVSDIAAQTLGSAVGMLAWVLVGQKLTDRTRAVWTRADLNAAGRLLLVYVVLLAFIQTLPFDVSVSPAALYRKFRDGGVVLVPFGEFHGLNDAERWKMIGKLTKLAGLYLPIGLLAARMKGRIEQWSMGRVALAALGLAVCMEALQLVVQSRTPSATDALVGAGAGIVGWYAARVHHEGLALPFAVSWLIVWLAVMTPVTQPPPGVPKRESPRAFDWVPGMPLESGDPLNALEEMLTKLILFGLLGVVVAAWRLPPRTKRGPGGSVRVAVVVAALLGLVAASFFEMSQRWYDTHVPCITDVLLGGFGAVLGVLVASRAK